MREGWAAGMAHVQGGADKGCLRSWIGSEKAKHKQTRVAAVKLPLAIIAVR